jgi:hypothetical protein
MHAIGYRFFLLVDIISEGEVVLCGQEHIEMTFEIRVPTEQNLHAVEDSSLADVAISPRTTDQPDADLAP